MTELEPDAVQASDGSVTLRGGQLVRGFHKPDQCFGEVCPVHNPTNHALRGQELFFNGKHMVRRVAGELFIDPDDYEFLKYGYAILRNSAFCAVCGDSLISKHRHDYVSCKCGAIAIDGGVTYLRRLADSWVNFIDTSLTAGEAK